MIDESAVTWLLVIGLFKGESVICSFVNSMHAPLSSGSPTKALPSTDDYIHVP
jgi:hypothetical protein